MTTANKFATLRKFLLALLLLPITTATAFAGEEGGIDKALGPIADVLESIIFYSFKVSGQGLPVVLVVLGGTAIFLTIYFKFINLRAIGLAIKTARGKYTAPDAPGQITHFQALTAALWPLVSVGQELHFG